jgi:hypothetical protein
MTITNLGPTFAVLAKTGCCFLSFGQESTPWPYILRRKTQKKEQSAENRRNFAVSTRQNNSLKDINNEIITTKYKQFKTLQL